MTVFAGIVLVLVGTVVLWNAPTYYRDDEIRNYAIGLALCWVGVYCLMA